MYDIEFEGPVCFELLPDGRRAKVLTGISLEYRGRTILTVPKGFETDFASVPRVLWSIIPPMGKYSKAAIIHDYLYFTGQVPRADADEVFLKLMEHLDVPLWKRTLMYSGVRVGGWVAWNDHRARDTK